jgi:(2Fe-2S) ferredoxin
LKTKFFDICVLKNISSSAQTVVPRSIPRGSCAQKGSEELVAKFKKRISELGLNKMVRVNSSGCLDACEHGISIVIYPEGIWYGGVKEEDIEKIISSHIVNGEVVDELMIKDEKFNPDLMLSAKIEPIQK